MQIFLKRFSNGLKRLESSVGMRAKTRSLLTALGMMDEPTTGEHDKNANYVTRLICPDKFIFEVHDLAIGESNTKVLKVTYTYKKP